MKTKFMHLPYRSEEVPRVRKPPVRQIDDSWDFTRPCTHDAVAVIVGVVVVAINILCFVAGGRMIKSIGKSLEKDVAVRDDRHHGAPKDGLQRRSFFHVEKVKRRMRVGMVQETPR
jgi:hypothetical protein